MDQRYPESVRARQIEREIDTSAHLIGCGILSERIRSDVHARNDTIQTSHVARLVAMVVVVVVMWCHAQHGRCNEIRLNVIQLRLVLV